MLREHTDLEHAGLEVGEIGQVAIDIDAMVTPSSDEGLGAPSSLCMVKAALAGRQAKGSRRVFSSSAEKTLSRLCSSKAGRRTL